jgi:hypothetical protein
MDEAYWPDLARLNHDASEVIDGLGFIVAHGTTRRGPARGKSLFAYDFRYGGPGNWASHQK